MTTAETAALEATGATNVRDKLRHAGPGRGAAVRGFSCGELTRGDIEDWLAAKERADRQSARRRADIAIATSLVSLAVGLAGLLLALLK